MTIDEFIAYRGLTRILHFTRLNGLLGMLATWTVKSRQQLLNDRQLEYIYQPNALYRKDPNWLDYVNLSIEHINPQFFEICSKKWHKGTEWCIISFSTEILNHDGVVFVTTNNMYSDAVRGVGINGLKSLYADRIVSAGSPITRQLDRQFSLPTSSQAEVLYPRELSLDYANCIYLSTDEHSDSLEGQLATLGTPRLHYEVNASLFGGN